MNINIKDIDIDRLRSDLIDYFMAIVFGVSPVAFMDISEVENASDEKLIEIALSNNFDLSNYLINNKAYMR